MATPISIYASDALYHQLTDLAATEHRSISGQVLYMIEQQLAKEGRAVARKSAITRASRIPDDFTVTEVMVAWACATVPAVDGRKETEKFVNHWRASNLPTARKRDWVAAWRNWMLKAEKDYPGGRPVKTRDQEATDQMFERMYDRARRRDAERELSGDRGLPAPAPRSLPSAED